MPRGTSSPSRLPTRMGPLFLAGLLTISFEGGPVFQRGLAAQTPDDAPRSDEPPDGWNAPPALELVERARGARRTLAEDGALRSYSALTDGHIYFFVDPEVGERSLIRIDQVAVEVHWRAPDETRQQVIGERSETLLPVQDFRYYTDRLTLLQYGLGDEIQVGSGLDVAGVPHPFVPILDGAPGSPYDFRLGDSLSLALPGRPEALRLQEIEVRPRDPGAPGAIGSITVERATGEIVRMSLTFTPASYVDPRTDRISVELDYGLWEGRYWLPNLQRIEVRREWPPVDLGVGTVIRAVLRTSGYRLNAPVPAPVSLRPPVTRAPSAARASHPFPEGLYDGIERDGLAEVVRSPDVEELTAQAYRLVEERSTSGLSAFRLHLPRASSLLRYSRAEGLVPGAGFSFRPGGPFAVRAHAGYGIGDGRVQGGVHATATAPGGLELEGSVRLRDPRDLGLSPGSDALLSSLGTLFAGEDYRDPWFATGARVAAGGVLDERYRFSLALALERHESGTLVVSRAPLAHGREARPVRTVREGTFATLTTGALWSPEWAILPRSTLEVGAELVSGDLGRGTAVSVRLETLAGPPSREYELRFVASRRIWEGDPLPQGHRLVGGRGTLPGYPFRSFVGRDVGTLEAVASADAWRRLVRIRAGLYAGWASNPDPTVAAEWGAEPSGGLRGSASVGVGLGWDLLRVDLARGFEGGEWQVILSLDPAWWGYL